MKTHGKKWPRNIAIYPYLFNKSVIKIFRLFLLLLIFLYFGITLFKETKSNYFHVDEYNCVSKSYFFDLYLKGDFESKDWLTWASYDQPKLSQYFFGLILRLNGIKNISDYFKSINFDEKINGNILGKIWDRSNNWWIDFDSSQISIDIKNKLSPIIKCRQAVAIISLGLLILVFLLGKELVSFWFGITYSLLIFFNPLFRLYASRAMADGILLFFFLFSAYLSFLMRKELNKNMKFNIMNFLIIIILAGIAGGLAFATKLNGIIIFGYWLMLILIVNKRDRLLFLTSFLIILNLGLFIFLLANPFLWKNQIQNTIFMFNYRFNTIAFQENIFGGVLKNYGDKIFGMIKVIFFDNHIISSEVDLILFLIGFFILLRQIVIKKRWQKFNLIFIWFCFSIILITAYVPIRWDRYYLPMIPVVVFCQAVSISNSARFIFRRFVGLKLR